MSESARDIHKEADKAIASQVFRATCQLVRNNAPPEERLGSGVGVRMGERRFIATAGHIVLGDPGLEIVQRVDRSAVLGPFPSIQGTLKPDVGLIQLTPDQATALGSDAFVGEDALFTGQLPDDHRFVLTGFPAGQVVPMTESIDLGVAAVLSTYALPSKEWPTNLRNPPSPDSDLLLKWDAKCRRSFHGQGLPSDGTPPVTGDTTPPPGMSGGGIWLPIWSREAILSPAAKLIGLQSSCYESSSLLRVVRINCWLDLLLQHCPDLQSIVTNVRQKTPNIGPV